MNSSAYGLIHDYYPREKMISIKWEGKISYFYFPKKTFKYFEKAMKYKSVYVFFDYTLNEPKILKNVTSYQIVNLHRIQIETQKGPEIIYTSKLQSEKLVDAINKNCYKMFIDFEFTMPPYDYTGKYNSEILQAGIVVVDENENIIQEYSNYIKTKNEVSLRTKKFLGIFDQDLVDSVEPTVFYEDFKKILTIYKPVAFTWGGSDNSELQSFYKTNNLEPLKLEVVDLSNLIKRYYNLDNEMGLFNALKFFKHIGAEQLHHALTDAVATKEIFDSFKQLINSNSDFDLKEEFIKSKKETEENIESKN